MAEEVSAEQIQVLDEMVACVRVAADVIVTYDQGRADRLCQVVAAAVCDMKVWASIYDKAVNETDLGNKVTGRNKHNKVKLILRNCLRSKSVGIIEEIPEEGPVEYAKPMGVITTLVLTASPYLTPAGQIIYAVKVGDALICSPRPRAKNVINRCISIIRKTLIREGTPADIIQGTQEPDISLAQELMRRCDLVIAAGSRPMVKSVYFSGVPAFGPGAGNATAIVDDTTNVPERQREAAMNARISKTSDLGSGCFYDGSLLIRESVYDGFVQALMAEGAYLVSEEEVEKLKNVVWGEIDHRLSNITAISPQKLAEIADFKIPADHKLTAVTGSGKEGVGKEHFFSSEKLIILLAPFKYEDEFENALDMMRAVFEVGGKGHSCGIHSWNDEHIHRLSMAASVSRTVIRQPNNHGDSGFSISGAPLASSMGCGIWGGNIVSESITLKHYMNTTWIAHPLSENMPSNQELFGDYFKKSMDKG